MSSEGIVISLPTLNFDSSNFDSFQTIKIEGIDDNEIDGEQEYHIKIYVNGENTLDNTGYKNIPFSKISLINQDDDSITGGSSGGGSNPENDNLKTEEETSDCFIKTFLK